MDELKYQLSKIDFTKYSGDEIEESVFVSEIHSFARSQAIELGKWIHEDDNNFYYDGRVGAWRSLGDDKLYSDDEVHTAFLVWQKKQQEGKGE
jgi:hypothetical protein